MFALVDCNNFYVSCERIFRPELRNKPVVVLSNNDGCIISRSEEAKALGIKMGVPVFKIQKELEKNQIQVFSSNYALYGDLSNRVMSILNRYTEDLQFYSIDEAFLQVPKMNYADQLGWGTEIRDKIYKELGLPVSVSIAPTKTLTKITSEYLKTERQKVQISSAQKISSDKNISSGIISTGDARVGIWPVEAEIQEALLKGFRVSKIWGIGRNYAELLEAYNQFTAWDFRQCNRDFVKTKMGVVGLRIQKELASQSCIEIKDMQTKKNILTSRSFGYGVYDFESLKESVIYYLSKSSIKLRKQGSLAGYVGVFLQSHKFTGPGSTGYDRYYGSKGRVLESQTNFTGDLAKVAGELLQQIYKPGLKYKKSGVILSNISAQGEARVDLFGSMVLDDKKLRLNSILDKLQDKYGSKSLFLAGQGIKQNWQMRSAHRSPSYTTDIRDVLRVG